MSMSIHAALFDCCEGIKEFASSAATWIGKTVSAVGATIADTASKVAQFVRPHFENLKTFAQENKESLIIAGIAFAVGAIVSAVITHVFCRGTGHQHATSTTAQTV